MDDPKKNRRPDLEMLETPQSAELIAGDLLPPILMGNSAGKIFYQSAVTIVVPQTDREPGAEPTRTIIGSDDVNFTCSEVLKRYFIPENRVKDKGGLDKCDKVGGQAAKLSVLQERERRVAALLLQNGVARDATPGDTDIIKLVKTAKTDLLPYNGKLIFVCSDTIYDNIMERPEIQKRLARLNSVQPADNEQVATLDKKLLAMILKVDEVRVGANAYWGLTVGTGETAVNLSQRAAIFKQAPDQEESENMAPVFAKAAIYQPDDTAFEVRSFYDSKDYTYNYDALQYVDEVVFNTGACIVFSGITDPGEYVQKVGIETVINARIVNDETEPIHTVIDNDAAAPVVTKIANDETEPIPAVITNDDTNPVATQEVAV